MVNNINKDFYNTILAQAFSPCGNYLVTGDIYGNLAIFNVSKVLTPDVNFSKEELTPKIKITVKADYQINSLVTTPNHLLVGGFGEIYAYTWKSIKGSSRSIHVAWSIEIPNGHEELNKAEVNALIYDEDNGNLIAGCGDNNIYILNIESRNVLKVLSGHSDYIHCLTKNGSDLLSSGEDGVVNIWDLRTNKAHNKIEPFKYKEIERPDLGKWIGAVHCNEDYILCGGGPRLSLFHYRFLAQSTIFPFEDKGIHVAQIHDDKVLAGGRCKLFYQASLNGNVISEIPISGPTAYSMVKQVDPYKIMCIAGSSPKIDISTNFIYKDQQLCLYF
ncbi:THO complex subunit 6 homolog [Sitophilus oryzae]|uniref:THO complex subunit 6 homolog n=1 Tax=Sitophilus oryzae TaxID=7048 RepID=A0A6J2YFN8_SITOR|nr:THO complex subunit 6 homolog [Sitophilus oryzae]